ncbi:dihydrofolate reductase family protein [Cryobacterium sp. 1639]|uniref:dihydrofolate reductase family protein n=1 Tax=Cryobacterium inferilacus TaxID=2866629 RepID=UPI001C73B96D|nr:dihydrofolate reductase family protein [Cryobacterium sp. 1639]MBX0298782.1 dihydrofolate reductase family protein [Cryobacterium sp. 1639]
MGNLVVQQFVTADGFAADADNEFTAYELLEGGTAELDRSQADWLDSVDAMVLGARTYRMFVGYWPTPAAAGEIITAPLNALRRHVFSRTLQHAPWGEQEAATVESGDAVDAIRRIKAETDGLVVLWGSLSLSDTFFAAGEVDEVRLVILPVVIGAGRGAFPAAGDPRILDLQAARTFDRGLVELHYAVRPAPEW